MKHVSIGEVDIEKLDCISHEIFNRGIKRIPAPWPRRAKDQTNIVQKTALLVVHKGENFTVARMHLA
jgi:hypothetical protein